MQVKNKKSVETEESKICKCMMRERGAKTKKVAHTQATYWDFLLVGIFVASAPFPFVSFYISFLTFFPFIPSMPQTTAFSRLHARCDSEESGSRSLHDR